MNEAIVTCPDCGVQLPTFVAAYGPVEFYCAACDAFHEGEATPAED